MMTKTELRMSGMMLEHEIVAIARSEANRALREHVCETISVLERLPAPVLRVGAVVQRVSVPWVYAGEVLWFDDEWVVVRGHQGSAVSQPAGVRRGNVVVVG